MPQPFEYRIEQRIAVIGETGGGYTTELNRVAYRGYPPKLDLRKWREGKPLKGITLSEEEARNLYEALKSIFEKAEV